MLGAAAIATVGAALIIPNALTGVSAQSDISQAVSGNRDRGQVTRDEDRAPVVDPVSEAQAKAAEEARAVEQDKLAEQARAGEEARKAEEARIAEEERKAAEKRKAAEEAAATPSPVAPGNSGTAPIQEPAKPSDPPATGACAHGDGSSLGLTSQARIAFQAICARFPNVTSYGGWRPSSDDHGAGQAIDIMISSSDEGWEIANWLVANSSTYSVEYIIFEQRIWGSWAPGAGFVWMADRGSPTQNHYDHVHVTVR